MKQQLDSMYDSIFEVFQDKYKSKLIIEDHLLDKTSSELQDIKNIHKHLNEQLINYNNFFIDIEDDVDKIFNEFEKPKIKKFVKIGCISYLSILYFILVSLGFFILFKLIYLINSLIISNFKGLPIIINVLYHILSWFALLLLLVLSGIIIALKYITPKISKKLKNIKKTKNLNLHYKISKSGILFITGSCLYLINLVYILLT